MKTKDLLSTAVFVTALTATAGAQAGKPGEEDMRNWKEMQKEAVSAEAILSGKVKNIANLVGRIEHLILDDAKNDVQYVLFETPYPYSFYTGEDGYLNYDALDVEYDASGGINLLITEDTVTYPPDKLKLTRAQVDDRMVSRLIGRELEFDDGSEREIQDLLIHPKSGKVTHYVVEMNPDAVFSEEPRTIKAKNINVTEEGRINTDLTLKEVERQQEYDPGFL